MQTIKNRYIAYLFILTGLLVVLLLIFKDYIFNTDKIVVWTTGVIAFFFLYELMVIIITDKKGKTSTDRQLVNLYLGLKVGKIFLSLILVSIYAFVIKEEVKRFVLVFVLIYFIYLLFDTLYLSKREKRTKTKTIKNN